jgi:hypothetical protein
MISLPSDEKRLIPAALDLIERCRASAGERAAYSRLLNALAATGRSDGTRSLINMLDMHLMRTAAHLYSPVELRFVVNFMRKYPKEFYDRAGVAAEVLTNDFESSNTDMLFGHGVYDALKHGAMILKQHVQQEGEDQEPDYHSRLIFPWQFAVYKENENDLNKQDAFVETSMLTLPEVWRRIYHMPDAEKLFRRIEANSKRGQSDDNTSFMHQVLSTSQIQTGVTNNNTMPGGIVQLNNDPNYSIVGPIMDIDLVRFHELWVKGKKDYETIQIIEPDILITKFKRGNLLVPGDMRSMLHPYTLIQPNVVSGYFWGETELAQLIAPQGMLSDWADDIKRLFGVQVDKILAFIGDDGLSDETYAQFRGAGYRNMPPGADVKDITPKFPAEAMPMLKLIMEIINTVGGFPAIMQGQGEQGVRAGSHANTLLKTGSPSLRDRSLLVERQVAQAADTRLWLKQYKDPTKYWTNGESVETMNKTSFLLTDLPDDRRVSVDSHSSSPIFADDHQQLTAFGVKAGFIDGETAIDDLPFPNKELKKQRLKTKQERQQQMMQNLLQQNPELGQKMAQKQLMGGKR